MKGMRICALLWTAAGITTASHCKPSISLSPFSPSSVSVSSVSASSSSASISSSVVPSSSSVSSSPATPSDCGTNLMGVDVSFNSPSGHWYIQNNPYGDHSIDTCNGGTPQGCIFFEHAAGDINPWTFVLTYTAATTAGTTYDFTFDYQDASTTEVSPTCTATSLGSTVLKSLLLPYTTTWEQGLVEFKATDAQTLISCTVSGAPSQDSFYLANFSLVKKCSVLP